MVFLFFSSSLSGQLKNLLIILASYIFWAADTPIQTNNIIGILIAITGSFYYMYLTFGSEKGTAPPPPTRNGAVGTADGDVIMSNKKEDELPFLSPASASSSSSSSSTNTSTNVNGSSGIAGLSAISSIVAPTHSSNNNNNLTSGSSSLTGGIMKKSEAIMDVEVGSAHVRHNTGASAAEK